MPIYALLKHPTTFSFACHLVVIPMMAEILLHGASSLILEFYLLVSISGNELSKALTSSINLSKSKSKPKLVKHVYKWSLKS